MHNIEYKYKKGYLYIKINNNINTLNIDNYFKDINNIINKIGIKKIILNLNNINSVDIICVERLKKEIKNIETICEVIVDKTNIIYRRLLNK